jgi:dephospho-CoA kinase
VIVAGLTGGIASGKSTVSACLRSAGAVVVDADVIARQVVRKGQPAHLRIVEYFGDGILLPDGEIDRRRLAGIVFRNPRKRACLEEIVHPLVQRELKREIAVIRTRDPEAVVILDVPLLFETRMEENLSDIIVVYAPEEVQIDRLMKRDGCSRADALARVRSQLPIEEKKLRATMVVDNTGPLRETREQALGVYERLKRRAIAQPLQKGGFHPA